MFNTHSLIWITIIKTITKNVLQLRILFLSKLGAVKSDLLIK